MNQKIKQVIMRFVPILNHIPFVNRFCGGGKQKLRIINHGSLFLNCRFQSTGQNNVIEFAKGGVFRNCEFLFFGNGNSMSFGDNCHATEGSFYVEDDSNAIIAGKDTMFAGKIHIACTESTQCRIGDGCLFSADIVFRTGDSHSILDGEGKRINPAKDITIGDRVWVGYRVLVNKGVTILSDSVIGTGSVVTKPMEESNVVIAGTPAKIIKRNITWNVEKV